MKRLATAAASPAYVAGLCFLTNLRKRLSLMGSTILLKDFVAFAGVFAMCASTSIAEQAGRELSFSTDVRPLLVKHCAACHGGVKQAGGLSFVYSEQVLPPEGSVVKPGDPAASPLMERITSDDPDLRMPPSDHGPSLKPEDIETFRLWIAQGAKWQQHWAFEKPIAPRIPAVRRTDWPTNHVDRFVLARLERKNVAPSPDADVRRWLRRVTLDLTGLPPTLGEVEQFVTRVQSNGELAYGEAVDRLLASPRYGERWASVWLDVVRYADSKGLGQDGPRNIWAYRDWVIRSLNDDLPYDKFTVKQLAGDLLPGAEPNNLIATACHRLTATNEEGGSDDEEFRVEAVLDRVNTTWQAWQGATFGCTQCHNHPYDPFRHEEYYRFAAYFNTSVDSDITNDYPNYSAPTRQEDFAKAAELDNRIDQLHTDLWQRGFALLSDTRAWKPIVDLQATTNKATRVAVSTSGDHDEFSTVGTVARDTDFSLEAPLPQELRALTALRVAILPHDPEKALADSEWGFVLSNVTAQLLDERGEKLRDIKFARVLSDSPESIYSPDHSLNEKSKQGWGAYSRINHPRQCALVLREPMEVPVGARIRVELKHRVFIVSAFSLISRRGHLAASDDVRFTELLSDPTYDSQRKQYAKLRKERNAISSTAIPVMKERPLHLSRPSYTFIRGSFLDKNELVRPGVPHSLASKSDKLLADRLAMARWIASPENPLTARVAVNRLWAQLFGAGLVLTEEDFGSSGEMPTHAKLLDYLARRFSDEYGWSTKRILRELVLSRTYRQSSKARNDLAELDPGNLLLTRGPRVRLTGEMVRDQALAVAGLLSDKMYGPPVHPPIPSGVWKPFKSRDKWITPKRGDENRYRRAVYTYTKRSIPYPMFATFDSPSREYCSPRRLRSNTPLQALITLNDEVFVECAAALAQRMANAAESPKEQIAHGYAIAVGHPATPETIADFMKLYHQCSDPIKSRQMVASVLLNLDELLVK